MIRNMKNISCNYSGPYTCTTHDRHQSNHSTNGAINCGSLLNISKAQESFQLAKEFINGLGLSMLKY